ncbi:MAG: ATPase P [Syntrophobacterales bacterium]|nr:ATPase P [Syntrophobacterales bacterium]
MLEIVVPGFKNLSLAHLVLDFNGTLAQDGRLLAGVAPRLHRLAHNLAVHVLTADTFGGVHQEMAGLPVTVSVIPRGDEARAKAEFLRALGSRHSAAVGNGRNDALMLQEADLGVAVVQEEGAAREALLAADLVAPGITAALDLFLVPGRLIATLRA